MPANKIKQLLEEIKVASLNKTLGELEAITRVIVLTNNVVDIQGVLPNFDDLDDIKRSIATIVKLDLEYPGVKINFIKDESEVEEEVITDSKIKYLAIASGKGGVGKSAVTVNLAYALRRIGKKVGIIDVDIYGASIPFTFDMDTKPLDLDENDKIIPANFEGVQIISTEFFVPKNKPLMWRAPIASQMTKMFFESVAWEEDTEIVLIDMPPGTGDIAIDVRELVPKSDMIIVTTPNISASKVAIKAGLGSKEIGHNVIGVIENMSFYYNSCKDEKEFIFGRGGSQLVCQELKVDLLAEIPIANLDSDKILFDMSTIQGKTFMRLAMEYAKNYL